MSFLSRLRALFRRNQLDRDMAEEMRFHLDERTDDHVDDASRRDPTSKPKIPQEITEETEINSEVDHEMRVAWIHAASRDARPGKILSYLGCLL